MHEFGIVVLTMNTNNRYAIKRVLAYGDENARRKGREREAVRCEKHCELHTCHDTGARPDCCHLKLRKREEGEEGMGKQRCCFRTCKILTGQMSIESRAQKKQNLVPF
jgi:hypothetical protein